MAGMFPLPRLIVGLALGLLLLASQVAGTRIWLDRRFSLGNEVHLPTRVQSAAAIISEDPAIIEPGATLRLRLKSDPSDVSLYIAMMTTKQYYELIESSFTLFQQMAPAKQKFEFKGDIDVTFALPTGGRLHVVLIVPPRSFQPLPPPPGQESAEGSSSPVPQYPDAIQLTGTLDYVNPNAGPFTVDNAPRRILSSIMLGLYCVLLVGVVLTLAGLLEHFGEGTPWQPLPQRPASDLVASGPVGTRGGGGSGALSRLNIAQSWKNNSVRWPTYFRLPWQHFEPAVDPRVLKELQLVALAVFACKLVQFILRTMYYELNYVTLMPDGDPLFLLSRPDTATAYPFAYLFYLQSFFGMLADALLVALLLVSALGWSLVYERVSEREVQLFGLTFLIYLIFSLASSACLPSTSMYDAVCFPFGAALSVAKFLISAFVLVYLFATYNWLGRLIAASLPTSGRGGSASGFTDNMRSIGRKRRLINELISVSVVHLILPIFITVCRIGLVPWFAGHAIEVVQELLFFGVTLFILFAFRPARRSLFLTYSQTETSRRVREMSAALRSEDGSGDGADERQPRLTPEQIHASAVAAVAALEQQRQATAPAPPGAASEAPPSGPSVDHAAEDAADDIAGAEADTILAHGLRQLLGESAAEMPGPAPTEPMATSPTAAMDLVFAGGSDAGRPQLQPYELSSDSASTSFSSSHTLLSDT